MVGLSRMRVFKEGLLDSILLKQIHKNNYLRICAACRGMVVLFKKVYLHDIQSLFYFS